MLVFVTGLSLRDKPHDGSQAGKPFGVAEDNSRREGRPCLAVSQLHAVHARYARETKGMVFDALITAPAKWRCQNWKLI